MASRIVSGGLRQGGQSEAFSRTWSQRYAVVPVALHILLTVCDYSECAVFAQLFPIVYWHSGDVNKFVLDAVGGAKVVVVGAVQYEVDTSYCEYCSIQVFGSR